MTRRLIEADFPLEATSIDSVHEKNVRHGHISTLHIWPARRPLAACRAALVATLLPDPGTPEARRVLGERLAGRVVNVARKRSKSGQDVDVKANKQTTGGILHWGREAENASDLAWFRDEIRKAWNGRPPRVLDPFAGGGAIPLEAMRLGCEVTASDINPVAWFVLKCTLDYPQRLAGQHRPLPDFVRQQSGFMADWFKALGLKGAALRTQLEALAGAEAGTGRQQALVAPNARLFEADLAWHVRAWGHWVLARARRELAAHYPMYADWEAPRPQGELADVQPPRRVTLLADGTIDQAALNPDGVPDSPHEPRWVAKPTVAYLWARTVRCGSCRAQIPLLKTRWLAKSRGHRALIELVTSGPGGTVAFHVVNDVPEAQGNAAVRREHDRRLGGGTMSRAGAWCPSCGNADSVAMKMDDIRAEGQAGRLGAVMTAVVVDGPQGKEYRLPTDEERRAAEPTDADLAEAFRNVPFGIPEEPTPIGGGTGAGRAFSVYGYGLRRWRDLFTPRQLLALGTLVRFTREAREEMKRQGYAEEWVEAVGGYLGCAADRLADYNSTLCMWGTGRQTIAHTFTRYALPITWDFCETNPIHDATGSYVGGVDWVALVVDHGLRATSAAPRPSVKHHDVRELEDREDSRYDAVVTDPPYYDAIPYADLADFFFIWLKRCLWDVSVEFNEAFRETGCPKITPGKPRGELIEDASRFNGDKQAAFEEYTQGMRDGFARSLSLLTDDGVLFVVFANKRPTAWEALVSALIQGGAVVDASWPIVTEMRGGVRNFGRASLASSVWLVCRRRDAAARAGWDTTVLDEVRKTLPDRLTAFWDAGIRGPDFVWAATGPALEAYSRHPVVKLANTPGSVLTVAEFLKEVRRIVVEYVVSRVLEERAGAAGDAKALDDVTTYYLLHRTEFGFEKVPAGACILYAVSCNISESELADRLDLLSRAGGRDIGDEDQEEDEADDEEDDEAEDQREAGSGSAFRLKPWQDRRAAGLGEQPLARRTRRGPADQVHEPGPAEIPLIDQVHRMMQLWVRGDQHPVNDYVEARGLHRSEIYKKLLQALIEVSDDGKEKSILEAIMNHLGAQARHRVEGGTLAYESRSGDSPPP